MKSNVDKLISLTVTCVKSILFNISKKNYYNPPLLHEFDQLYLSYVIIGETTLIDIPDMDRYFNIGFMDSHNRYPLDILDVAVSYKGIGIVINGISFDIFDTKGAAIMPIDNVINLITLAIKSNTELVARCQPTTGGNHGLKQTRK